jgi:hypothetical protein
MHHLVIVNHDVEDYGRWKARYAAHPPPVDGAIFVHVLRNIDRPANLTMIVGWETAEEARAFRDHPDLRAGMEAAGLVGDPRVEISEEIAVGS